METYFQEEKSNVTELAFSAIHGNLQPLERRGKGKGGKVWAALVFLRERGSRSLRHMMDEGRKRGKTSAGVCRKHLEKGGGGKRSSESQIFHDVGWGGKKERKSLL